MLFPPIDPNERFRDRRAAVRRRKRLRRGAALGSVLVVVLLLGMGAQFVGTSEKPQTVTDLATLASSPSSGPRTLPIELRGVHVTMGLASLPGKLDEYLELEKEGLTALELDVKDENGEVGFITGAVPRLAVSIGAARDYYSAREAAAKVHERGIYLVGRIVVFEDPVLSRARPDMAIRTSGGSVWRDAAGLGWTNPYDTARLGVQRRHRRRRGEGRLRRDHVRLRAVPVGRRRRRRRVPQRALAREARDGAGVPALREEQARPVRRPYLGRGLRSLRRARPRHRTASAQDGAATSTPSTR